ncbi:MAG: VRR-NUC domain-containing protein [Pseudomonadota bacterium]
MVGPLPVGYYLDNFNLLLNFVAAHYDHLLNLEEIAWRTRFQALSLDAARLYVRLCSRKGPLFRVDKLGYTEIGDLPAAIEELTAAGLVAFAAEEEPVTLLSLLSREELLARIPGPADRRMRRAEILTELSGLMSTSDVLACMPASVIRPLGLACLDVYRVLFFGNPYQGLTEFVLNDLGITPYESYEIDADGGAFPSREVMEDAMTIYALGTHAHEVIPVAGADELKALADALPLSDHDSNARRAARIRNRVARQLERLGQHASALEIYQQVAAFPPARERAARILAAQGDPVHALELCEQIRINPFDEAEYEFGVAFGTRLAKKLDQAPRFPSADMPVEVTNLVIAQLPGLRVEEQVRLVLAGEGQAFYVENALFPGLFGLVFWDIIFSPVKGAFINPFQRGPEDLFTPAFRQRRKDLIDARLDELSDPVQLREQVLETFDAKGSTANYFVHWGYLDRHLLETALAHIPAADLKAVFVRLLRDLRNNRSGFPDLVVFPDQGGYRLAEVKGPGDTLQKNQRRWLAFFRSQGVSAEVVSVQWL